MDDAIRRSAAPQVIALDANVLIRFLVEDDQEQSRPAKAVVQRALDTNSRCFVSEVVVCEVAWVLGSSYHVGRDEIARVLRQLLRARRITFPEGERLSRDRIVTVPRGEIEKQERSRKKRQRSGLMERPP